MTERPEISVAYLFTTDSMMATCLTTVDGKRFAVYSMEIAVPLDVCPLTPELINAKPVMLKATSLP